jgi:hypothetical protein
MQFKRNIFEYFTKSLTLLFVFAISNIVVGQKDMILHLPFNNSIANTSQYSLEVNQVGKTSFVEGRNGISCNALEFSGNNYITVNHQNAFNQIKNEFSVTSWLKVTKSINNEYWVTLFCKGDEVIETNSNPHFRTQLFQNDTQSTISTNTEFTEYDSNFINHKIELNNWFHFALVCSKDKVDVYLNGNRIWSYNYYNSFISNSSPLYIGRDIPGGDEYFTGVIDDFKLYNRSLSDNEIIDEMYESNDEDFINDISCPKSIIAYSSINNCNVKVDYLSTSNNQCGNYTNSIIKGLPSGSLFPVGINKIVLKKTNSNKSKFCQFNVEVRDTISPVIKCAKDTIIITDNLPVKVILQKPTVNDNCSTITLKNQDTIFTNYGIHNKLYHVFDDSGNSAKYIQKIEIIKKTERANILLPAIKDSVIVKKNLKFSDDTLTVFLFDHKHEDGDIISLFFNAKEIIHKQKMRNKNNIKKEVVRMPIKLNPGENLFIVQAWNTGTSGPNTVRIEFYKGEISDEDFLSNTFKPLYAETINSEIGLASAIKLQLK